MSAFKSNSGTWQRVAVWGVVILALVWLAPELWARLGGGGGYSGGGGGSSSSGGGGGDAEAIGVLLELWVRFCIRYPYIGLPMTGGIVYWWIKHSDDEVESLIVAPEPVDWEKLRKHDANFSEVLLRDFGYSLFAKIHEARGAGQLSRYRQYLKDGAIERLQLMNTHVTDVQGVVVGSMQMDQLRVSMGPDEFATIRLRYDANYTEICGTDAQAVYTRQTWKLRRRADALSPPPERISSLGCVGCGSSEEPASDGTCPHCGNQYERGEHHWLVTGVTETASRNVGPALTTKADDVGYDLPTIFDPDLEAAKQQLLAEHPDMDFRRFCDRVRHIYHSLQKAWSEQHLDALRPYETDSLFHNHKYWIQEYQRQSLRNVLEEVKLDGLEVVKVRSDKFYDAITCRLRASMIDYTVDSDGKTVCGSRSKSTKFSEYWTLVRGRDCGGHDKGDEACPNCGAVLKISMAGECEYCGSKLSSGDFDWVLSEIQQDEAYGG